MTLPNQEVFSDEDRKWLENYMAADKEFHANSIWIDRIKLEALLSRLDAAEAVCQQTEIYITDETPKMFRSKELLKAWCERAKK